MKIVANDTPGAYRTGGLRELTPYQITEVLGFSPNIETEDIHRINCSWGFTVDGEQCGIWGYEGRVKYGLFSTFGPREIFVKLFGEELVV